MSLCRIKPVLGARTQDYAMRRRPFFWYEALTLTSSDASEVLASNVVMMVAIRIINKYP